MVDCSRTPPHGHRIKRLGGDRRFVARRPVSSRFTLAGRKHLPAPRDRCSGSLYTLLVHLSFFIFCLTLGATTHAHDSFGRHILSGVEVLAEARDDTSLVLPIPTSSPQLHDAGMSTRTPQLYDQGIGIYGDIVGSFSDTNTPTETPTDTPTTMPTRSPTNTPSNTPIDTPTTTPTTTPTATPTSTPLSASLSVTTHGAESGPTSITFTVTLSGTNTSGAPLSFTINPTAGTAVSGSDYTSFANAVITVASGSSTGTYSVAVIDDDLLESSETLTATISNAPSGTVITTASATATISDNDTATVSIAITSSGTEGSANLVYTVSLSKINNRGLALPFTITPSGNATSGSDYTAPAATVSIPNGASSATITVAVIDDALLESTETVTLTLSNPPSGISVATASASGSITDNDTASLSLSVLNHGAESGPTSLVYRATLSRTNNTGATITVTINPTGGTATSGSDYSEFSGATISILNGSSMGSISVAVIDDVLFENTETVTATISSPSHAAVSVGTATATANITDNDNGAGSIVANLTTTTNGAETGPVSIVYTVTLSKTNDTSGPVNVSISSSGGHGN